MIQVKTEVDQKVLNLSATQSTPAVAAPPADYAHVQSLVQTQIDELRDQIFKNFQNFDQALQSNQEIIAGELGRLEEEMNTKITASVSNIPTPIDHMPAINELESKFESNLSELTSKMSGLETKLNTVDLKSNSHHDQSNANKAEFKEKITQVEYRINEAKQSMNAIQPMFTNMQKELGELSQFFREMKARVDYLQNNYEAINTAIKGISTQMSNFTLGEISDRVWKYLSGGHPILTDAAKSIQQLKALMARLPEHLAQAPPTPGGRGGVPTHSMPMNNSHALNNNSGVNGVANHLPNPVVEQQIAELRNQISQFGQDIATFRLGMETSLRATEGQLKEHQLEYLPGRLSENEEVLRGFIVENTSGRLNKHIQEYDQHLQEYREKMDEISAWSVHILSRLMEMHKQITMVLSKLELPPMPKTGSEEPSSSNRGDMRIGGAADTNSAPPASSNQPQAIQQSHSLVQHASNIQGSGSTMDGDRWRAVGRDEIN